MWGEREVSENKREKREKKKQIDTCGKERGINKGTLAHQEREKREERREKREERKEKRENLLLLFQ